MCNRTKILFGIICNRTIFEDIADKKLQKIEEKKQKIKNLRTEIRKIEQNSVDMALLEDIKAALQWISTKEVEKLDKSDLEQRKEFFRQYVKEARISFLMEDTSRLRKTLGKLRGEKIYAKGNEDIRKLYWTCFTREHMLKQRAIQVLAFHVEFVGNLTVDIKFPYFHDNPEMAVSYVVEGNKCKQLKFS